MKRKSKPVAKYKNSEIDFRLLSKQLFSKLTKIKFKINGKSYEVDVGSEILINKEDPHNQVERIPAVLGYFGSVVTALGEEYENKKALQRQIEAKIDKKVRDAGFTGEMRIDKRIKRTPRWLDACMEVNKAEANYNKAKNLYFALVRKHEALNSRSADIRATPSDSIMGVSKEDVILFPKKKR